ncbi:hypothetical protein V8D89_001988 [Ganoderma adspersum]
MLSHLTTARPWVVWVVLLLLARTVQRRRKHARLPPGLTPLPLIGNVFHFPQTHLGREFAEMTKKFGDVIYLNVLGQDTIVLGSLKAARDLLYKRSANYSNRPNSVMVKLYAVRPTMAPEVVPQYEAFHLDAARNFLRLVLQNPEDLGSHIKFTFAAIVMGAIYGIELREPHDKYYHMIERMGDVGEEILTPGRFPVEAFPALRYLPSWFPGCGFKKWAMDSKRDVSNAIDSLFERSRSVTITDSDSSRVPMIHRILGDSAPQEDVELEKMCKEVAATMYVVVGSERLPDLSDRPSLSYITAIVKELLRWQPALPVGVPHRSLADDKYNGHLIPGGATVFVNIWAILRDPKLYPKPDEFIPDRFLDSSGNLDVNGRDPSDVVYGFGRRVSPGRYFAESTLFILVASVLSAFEIGPPVGEDSAPLPFKREASDHLIVVPHVLACITVVPI